MYVREMENIAIFIIFLKGRKKERKKKPDQKNMIKGKHKIDCLHYLKTHRAQSHEQITQFSKRHIIYSLLCAQGL